MEEYNVKISPAAQSDFREITNHMSTFAPEEAAYYHKSFLEKIEELAKAPDSCPFAKDAQLRLRGYRILPVGKYLVFYAIKDKVVDIRRILYSRRQYERLV